MITILFPGWISGRIVSLEPDTDIQKLLSNGNRIRIRISETVLSIFQEFRLLEKVAYCTIIHYYLQKRLFSLLYHDSEPVYGVISVPWRTPIPPLNRLIGHAKFVSMNLFLMWRDRALSVNIKDVVCCVPVPGLTLASVGLL